MRLTPAEEHAADMFIGVALVPMLKWFMAAEPDEALPQHVAASVPLLKHYGLVALRPHSDGDYWDVTKRGRALAEKLRGETPC